MNTPSLSRLERVSVRHIWQTEAQHFTPWLARPENLAVLGETLKMELELEAQEQSVGPFRADILCNDLATGNLVLIENQLERSDHRHLGQVLTYAAGLHAATIVWITPFFEEEHRAALDWLNSISDEHFRFFALEIELWRIGDSPVAPKFNVVASPNDWSRTVYEAARRIETQKVGPVQQLQKRFWEMFLDINAEQPELRKSKAPSLPWLVYSLGVSWAHLAAIFDPRSGKISVEFLLKSADGDERLSALAERRDELSRLLGFEPLFERSALKKMPRIISHMSDAQPNDESQWPVYCKWIAKTMTSYRRVFQPIVEEMDVATEAQ